MKEKERYEWGCNGKVFKHYILDTQTKEELGYEEVCDLLNKQDKRIKELEQKNGYVLFEDGYDENGNEINRQVYTTYKEEFTRLVLENKKLRKENQQLKQQLETFAHRISDQNEEILELKQQLHDLLKKIVEDIEKNFTEYLPLKYKTGAGFYSRLNSILKKYGWENE